MVRDKIHKKTLIDAGPIIAIFDRYDNYHFKIKYFMSRFMGELENTWPMITESLHMPDFHVQAKTDFLHWMQRDAISVHEPGKDAITRITEMTEQYADLPMDFADTTLLVPSEATGIRNIIAFDP